MIIFTIFLLSIVICGIISNNKKENFSSEINGGKNEYKDIKCKPLNMIVNPLKTIDIKVNKQNIIDNNIKITPEKLKDALKKINIQKPNLKYTELNNSEKINRCKVKLMIFKLLKLLKYSIETYLLVNNKKQCNKLNRCEIDFVDNNILMIGKNKNNTMIEGQILLDLKDSSFEFGIHYVVNNEQETKDVENFNINYLKLVGFDFKSKRLLNSNLNNNISDKYVNIYNNPIGNSYNTQNTYYYTSDEKPILLDEKYTKKYIKFRNINYSRSADYRCYGKSEQNKDMCESRYDKFGKKYTKVGIWDKPCSNNSDCPFYKQNTNYPNSFGGCVSGKCQMPVGVNQISPTKFININKAVCYNCKKGLFCCKKQNNKKKYKKLSSPDYHFENDSILRQKHRNILLSKGLKSI